jgi:predicted nucleotidyltransferase
MTEIVDRLPALDAARKLIKEKFPECKGAILGGSVVMGEDTATSDLDIVVIMNGSETARRESFYYEGWPVELFVHTIVSCREYFRKDAERARPTLPRMMAEGAVLEGEELLREIRKEARYLLDAGPATWTEAELVFKRYFLTDALEDFIGSANRHEALFIAGKLAELAHEFVLRANKRWIGQSKWIYRELSSFNPVLAERFVECFDSFYQDGDKAPAIELVDDIMKPFGGRCFDGFSLKGRKS